MQYPFQAFPRGNLQSAKGVWATGEGDYAFTIRANGVGIVSSSEGIDGLDDLIAQARTDADPLGYGELADPSSLFTAEGRQRIENGPEDHDHQPTVYPPEPTAPLAYVWLSSAAIAVVLLAGIRLFLRAGRA